MTAVASPFRLPPHLADKIQPVLIAADEAHLARVAAALEEQISALQERLITLRRAPGRSGRGALDRDLEIHHIAARLRLLRRFELDVCLGRIVPADGQPLWIGRLGLVDAAGDPLLVDWRAPAAEPFFAATPADPRGLVSRRRYRWSGGVIVDYWDEALDPAYDTVGLALDEDSAFLAGLNASRTPQMRDVLATLAADQDAVIRATSHGTLVVDGGPGTGKTVVALHRAAYLLYADPRLQGRRGGVLVVGPHRPYLDYVADVLPSLGEEGVALATLADLVPEGAAAVAESDPRIAELKQDARMAAAVEPAVALYEQPPAEPLTIETLWAEVVVDQEVWVDAFAAPDPGTPHNEARDQVWEALLDRLVEDHGTEEAAAEEVRAALASDPDLRRAASRAWPILEPTDLVADLWAVPAYLRRCAPWLTAEERALLRRPEGSPWTDADLPLLDAMRARLGDPEATAREHRRAAAEAADRAAMDDVVDDLLRAAREDPESPLQLLRRDSLRDALVHEEETLAPNRLAGPFAQVIVDEAQELTDAQWQILIRRCPARSFTVVGDRAQARRGFTESWEERLTRVGLDRVTRATLTVNYRTPAEVMNAAAPVIRAVLPDANVPTSIRSTGIPVQHGPVTELPQILASWTTEQAEGTACVVGAPEVRDSTRIRSLAPELVKGLEFDLVVLVNPSRWGEGVAASVDRYVAMTRATQRLVLLEG